MKKSLFLFTDSFPYGNGEQYLNEEFRLLESIFSNIYVIPVNILDKKRVGFEHVNVINIEQEIKIRKSTLIYNLYRYINLLRIELAPMNLENIKTIHHANENSEYIIDFIKKKGFKFQNITIYSYWFYHSALIASFIKEV